MSNPTAPSVPPAVPPSLRPRFGRQIIEGVEKFIIELPVELADALGKELDGLKEFQDRKDLYVLTYIYGNLPPNG